MPNFATGLSREIKKNLSLYRPQTAALPVTGKAVRKYLSFAGGFIRMLPSAGRGAVWLARLTGGQEVAGSSPVAPIAFRQVNMCGVYLLFPLPLVARKVFTVSGSNKEQLPRFCRARPGFFISGRGAVRRQGQRLIFLQGRGRLYKMRFLMWVGARVVKGDGL
jgi:hypothetical protein